MQDRVLHFACDSCGTHLGVDESLAGLEAPCPKCGKILVAPVLDLPEAEIRSAGVIRGVSGGEGFQVRTPSVRAGLESRRESSSHSNNRTVYPTSGRLANEDEKDNLRVLIKILSATALVVLIVILVTWFLKNF